jgi:hypothetical protein
MTAPLLSPELVAAIAAAEPELDLESLSSAALERLFELVAEAVWATDSLPAELGTCVARAVRETSGQA